MREVSNVERKNQKEGQLFMLIKILNVKQYMWETYLLKEI